MPAINPPFILKTKVVNITRVLTAGSGDVAYTGVGFTPKMGYFSGAALGESNASFGADDGTNKSALIQNSDGTTYTYVTTQSIYARDAGGNHNGVIKTWDADGFTITWTKNAPASTGTLNVTCMLIG